MAKNIFMKYWANNQKYFLKEINDNKTDKDKLVAIGNRINLFKNMGAINPKQYIPLIAEIGKHCNNINKGDA